MWVWARPRGLRTIGAKIEFGVVLGSDERDPGDIPV
jgi:hypothetical protein